jgi:hypothetical protein
MGFFKKFGQKAHSLGRFGTKAAKAVAFGAKRAAHGAAKYGTAFSNIASVGAAVAMEFGQPEIAAPLIGLAQGAARIAERGKTAEKGIRDIRHAVHDSGLQKPKKEVKTSPFESHAPQQPAAQPAMKFESHPPPSQPPSAPDSDGYRRPHRKGRK